MPYTQIKTKWMRCLLATLILSLGANAALFSVLIYARFKETPPMVSYSRVVQKKEASKEFNLQELVEKCATLSFRKLCLLLSNSAHVEEGYTVRDVALSALVTFRDLDLEAILPGATLRKKSFSFPKNREMALFSGLTDAQYDALIQYVHTEKWPLTARGLLKLLKGYPTLVDSSLQEAFYVKQEFNLLKIFFHRTDPTLSSKILIQLVSEGDYDLLHNFVEEQRKAQDFSIEKRRALLLAYVAKGSKMAARLLLQTDFLYVVKKLEDGVILQLLTLLDEKTQDGEQFCYELLKSGRSDAVWEKSASILYRFAGETAPNPYNHEVALSRFVRSDQLRQQWQEEEEKKQPLGTLLVEKKTRTYKVQEGDTLWKIARKHKVELDRLIELNQIKKERIRAGTLLVLPD